MLIYAHRGACLKLPENTIEAFRQGLFDGATGLELDVRISSDDVVVVFHDATGWRMAHENKSVADTPWSEIKTWQLGKRSRVKSLENSFVKTNFRVPMLAEVLEAFPGVFINIDIKDHSKKAVTLVVELLKKYQAVERVRLASFSFRVHEFLRDLKFEGLVSLSRAEIIKTIFMPESFLKEQYLEGKAIQIPVSWGPFPLDSENFIAKCHRLGLKVEYWTINSRQVAKKLQQRGADGIMSDDPAAVNINLA